MSERTYAVVRYFSQPGLEGEPEDVVCVCGDENTAIIIAHTFQTLLGDGWSYRIEQHNDDEKAIMVGGVQ